MAKGGAYSAASLLRREEAENLVIRSKFRSKVSKAYRLECPYLVARGCSKVSSKFSKALLRREEAEDLVVCTKVSSKVSKAPLWREEAKDIAAPAALEIVLLVLALLILGKQVKCGTYHFA